MIVPAVIHSHLIPFLYGELGKEDKKVNGVITVTAPVSPHSSVGHMLQHCISFSKAVNRSHKVTCYLSFSELCDNFKDMYGCFLDDNNNHIMLDARGTSFLNNFLEDIMRTAMIYYIIGRMDREETDDVIRKSISSFMERYDLFLYGFSIEGFRQVYYRSVKRDEILRRFRIRPKYRKYDDGFHVTSIGGNRG
jgi:hypothetical protein